MVDDDVRHPVIVDTDALIAVANTSLWPRIVRTLQLTTTNVCYHELTRHKRETSEHAPDGTREKWLHDGCTNALDAFDDETDSFTVVSCVPRPHGEDAGEQSLRNEIEQHPETYRFAILMDKHGRRSLIECSNRPRGRQARQSRRRFYCIYCSMRASVPLRSFATPVGTCFAARAGSVIKRFRPHGKRFLSTVRNISADLLP